MFPLCIELSSTLSKEFLTFRTIDFSSPLHTRSTSLESSLSSSKRVQHKLSISLSDTVYKHALWLMESTHLLHHFFLGIIPLRTLIKNTLAVVSFKTASRLPTNVLFVVDGNAMHSGVNKTKKALGSV